MNNHHDDHHGHHHGHHDHDDHHGHHHGHHADHHQGHRDYSYNNDLFTARFILIIFAMFILFSVILLVSSSKN